MIVSFEKNESTELLHMFLFSTEQTPSYEPKDGTESTYTQRRYVNTEQFIILFTGLLISAALIIAILWETYKYRKLKTPTTIKSSTNVNYEDIAV